MTAQARKKKAFAPDMLRLLLENYEIAPEWIEANFEVPVKKKPLPLIEPQKNLPAPTQANNLLPDLYGKMPEAVNGIVEDFFELFTEAMNEWAKEIYAGGGEALNEDMITLNYEAIWSGLVSRMKLKGYTDAYIQALRENVFIFSGAKTYEEYTQIKSFLVDEKGNKRSFQDFSDLVLKVNSTYNKQYLDAEYELAVASSQMIQLWQDIEKEDNPMLQFYAVGDERTTPICKNLNKITLPANDSFWDKYYPPNHWRCRSTVKVVYDETPTATLKNLPTLNKEFQNNVGKTSTVFTEAHPYFDKLPEAISKELLKKAKEYAQ
jgi:SPP1 gp7 family putative phage head morphogenesis protein